ncbi:siderophore-iron reductase FhuF [Caldalkalibacillus salinus]|uniref:siderophore-iron reductase FhuF n=1 Tax=Caldalkalibacillus salinus TaxID=2803787 RepID=UPI0019236E92|nr:siderophore-iron reductase FhuF [Caldalkalibacillus salinus]
MSSNIRQILHTKFHTTVASGTTITDHAQGEHSVAGPSLIASEHFDDLIGILDRTMGQQSPRVNSASLFSKYYGNLISLPPLYMALHHGVVIDFRLRNIVLQTPYETWKPRIVLRSLDDINDDHEHVHGEDALLYKVIRQIFGQNMAPVFHFLSDTYGVKQRLLWDNIAFSIQWAFETWVNDAHTVAQRTVISRAYERLTSESPTLFGLPESEINPLAISCRTVPHPQNENEQLKLRKQCCLRYSFPQGQRCLTCPNISEEERKRLHSQ